MKQPSEQTKERKVFCTGFGNNNLGHPAVYLKIAKNQTSTVCPYCSKKFILENNNKK